MKRIAVIGSGIAGSSAAYYLNKLGHDVSLFEAGDYFGGHTNTIEVEINGNKAPVDTGFLVHNDRTYPNLIDFFKELKIATHPSEMSFSVVRKMDDLIWAGNNLFSVFAQFKNIFSRKYFKFLKEVWHFNKNAHDYLIKSEGNLELTLGDLLKEKKYSEEFKNWYLLPMGGCIWSSPTDEMLNFPAFTFLRFCINHGLLQIFNRPKWKTVAEGGQTYVKRALLAIEKKYLNEPVLEVLNTEGKIVIVTHKKTAEFDYCIICSHPPETLKMLKIKDLEIHHILSKFKYQKNVAVVHTDETVLPMKKKVWAAWNYLSVKSTDKNDAVSVSYLINKLQPLPFMKSIIVTLNPVTDIDKLKMIKVINYQHPLFSTDAILGQEQMASIQGKHQIYYSGAWMRYGFHEDGILSSKMAIKKLLADNGQDHNLIKVL